MRQVHLPRLNSFKIKSKDPNYIHLYFLNQDIKDALNKYARGSLLDLGCGNKPYEELYKDITDKKIGSDVIQSDKNKVDVICLATELPFENNYFDTILCSQVMEHVYDYKTMINESYRVLKNEGTIILTVPFAWELHEEPHDYCRFTKHALRNIFEDAGFRIEYIKPNGGKWAAIYQLRNNMLFSAFKNKTWYNKLKKILFIELRLLQLRNLFAVWLDKKFRDEIFTLNYIIVAKKN